MEIISFDDWKKLEIKVGEIISAEKVAGADKLYKLQVDIGEDDPRQIVSGLVDFYTEDELKGKKIVVLANLQPAKFRGVESNGMLLAAGSDDETKVVLITPEEDIEKGSVIT